MYKITQMPLTIFQQGFNIITMVYTIVVIVLASLFSCETPQLTKIIIVSSAFLFLISLANLLYNRRSSSVSTDNIFYMAIMTTLFSLLLVLLFYISSVKFDKTCNGLSIIALIDIFIFSGYFIYQMITSRFLESRQSFLHEPLLDEDV